MKIKAFIPALLLILAMGMNTVSAIPDISVILNSVSDNSSSKVDFPEYGPICRDDNITLAPLRAITEAAGMKVDWNPELKTAKITLAVDKNSKKPVVVYASKLIDRITDYGLELIPVSITATFRMFADKALIRYNFMDSEGDIVSIGNYCDLKGVATIIDDRCLLVPLRSMMEIFGLTVNWHQDTSSVHVSIPDDDKMIIPTGLRIVGVSENPEAVSGYNKTLTTEELMATPVPTPAPTPVPTPIPTSAPTTAPEPEKPLHGAHIGKFKITHYRPGAEDNGIWGNKTAWAGDIRPGITIAVDPNVIPKLSWVYIDGYGLRRAEDCGGAVKGYVIDVAVNSFDEVKEGVVYRDVYWAE